MWWCLMASALSAPPLTEAMHERFDLLAETRDHVVQGRLEEARTAAASLAGHPPPDGLPSAWAKSLKQVRRDSKKVSRSKDLVEAALAVGQVGQSCGECHAATNAGPAKALRDLPPQTWDEGQNMVLHKWAADWMWLGLVSSDEPSWQRGVRALADRPLEMVFQQAAAPTDKPQLEQLVYLLADQAKTTAINFRGEVMGQLLATCAECHVTERAAE